MAHKRLFKKPLIIGGIILVLILLVLISVRLFREGFVLGKMNVSAGSGQHTPGRLNNIITNPSTGNIHLNTCTTEQIYAGATLTSGYSNGPKQCVDRGYEVDKDGKICSSSVLGCDHYCNSGKVNGCDGQCGSPACPPPPPPKESLGDTILNGLKSVGNTIVQGSKDAGQQLAFPKHAGDPCSEDLPCPTNKDYKCAYTARSSYRKCLSVRQDGQFLGTYSVTSSTDPQTETCRGDVTYDYLGRSYDDCKNTKKGGGGKVAYCGSIPAGWYACPDVPER